MRQYRAVSNVIRGLVLVTMFMNWHFFAASAAEPKSSSGGGKLLEQSVEKPVKVESTRKSKVLRATRNQEKAADRAEQAAIKFEKKRIQVGQISITAEIADDNPKRAHGLMHRTQLEPNSGMLFIFDDEQQLMFWMKNTRIPLAIAFVNSSHKIIDIQEMVPASDIELTPTTYASNGLAKYALEMSKGWFAKNKIKVGDSLKFQ